MMKFIYVITLLLSAILNTSPVFSQVRLPIDASNCAIYNALMPNDTSNCVETSDMGASRGLIIQMDSGSIAPDAQQTIATLTAARAKTTPSKSSKIDRQAAKSENGYYIHFAFNSEALEKEYRAHLDRLAIVLNTPSMRSNCVKITGHTDTVGDAKYNLKLSDRRAKSVYNYLITIEDIGPERFTTVASGESQPLSDKKGTSPFNRRVEFSSKSDTAGCLQLK